MNSCSREIAFQWISFLPFFFLTWRLLGCPGFHRQGGHLCPFPVAPVAPTAAPRSVPGPGWLGWETATSPGTGV